VILFSDPQLESIVGHFLFEITLFGKVLFWICFVHWLFFAF